MAASAGVLGEPSGRTRSSQGIGVSFSGSEVLATFRSKIRNEDHVEACGSENSYNVYATASTGFYFVPPPSIFFPVMLSLALLLLPLVSAGSIHERHAHTHSHNRAKRLPSTWYHRDDHPGSSLSLHTNATFLNPSP